MSADPALVALHREPRPRGRALAWCLANRFVLVVWGAMLVWTTSLFAIVRSDYLGFRLARFDLGNMTQAVWSTAHGHVLQMTSSSGEEVSRLAAHVDPILVLATPLWLAWPSPLALAGVQIVAVALGALPVFWLARRHLGSEVLACLLALVYLVYPWLAWTAADAMHPVTFAIPLFLYAIWFLDTDRLLAFAPFAVLAALTGELMGLTVAALGVWYALLRGRRVAGAAIGVAGLLWAVIAVVVVVPAFAGGASGAYGNYQSLGGSPQGVVRTAFTDPGAIAAALVRPRDLLYLLWLGAPLAGVFVLAPWLALVAAPQLLVNGLSDATGMTDPRLHYVAAIIPVLVAASIVGLARIRPERRTATAVFVLALCAVFSFVAGAWPATLAGARSGPGIDSSPAHVSSLREAVALVPGGAPVSSTNALGSHLSARRYLYSVPDVGRAEWIVVDTHDPVLWHREGRVSVFSPSPADLRAFTLRIERSPRWTGVFAEDGVLVFRRVARG